MLFLRVDEAFAVRRVVADEGFRDEERAVRGAFFLFKSFSLLESRDPSQCSGTLPEPSSNAILADGGVCLTTVFSALKESSKNVAFGTRAN